MQIEEIQLNRTSIKFENFKFRFEENEKKLESFDTETFFQHAFLEDSGKYATGSLFSDFKRDINEIDDDLMLPEIKEFRNYKEMTNYFTDKLNIHPDRIGDFRKNRNPFAPENDAESTKSQKKLLVVEIQNETQLMEKNYKKNITKINIKALKDLSEVSNVENAIDYLDTYGTDAIFGIYSHKSTFVKVVEISSPTNSDVGYLKVDALHYLKNFDEKCQPGQDSFEWQYTGNYGENINIRLFYINIKSYYQFNLRDSKGSFKDTSVMSVPIWMVLYEYFLTNPQFIFENDSYPEYLMFEANFLELRIYWLVYAYYLRKYTKQLKRDSKGHGTKMLEITKFCKQSVVRDAELYFKMKLGEGIYKKRRLPDVDLMNECRKNFSSIIENYSADKKMIDKMLECDRIKFLDMQTRLDVFLKLNEKKYNIVFLYYNRDLRLKYPKIWDTCFESFCDYIMHDSSNLSNNVNRHFMGVLVDYDLHDYLKERLNFFKRSIKIEYHLANLNQEIVFNKKKEKFITPVLNLSSQKRIALNDLKIPHDKNRYDLSENLLHVLDTFTFTQFPNQIIELDLKQNAIKHIQPNTFDRLYLLERLNLSSNFLKDIPSGLFRKTVSLNYLNLSGNLIESLNEDIFDDLYDLKELNLGSNSLSTIQAKTSLFKNLKNVVIINLQNNQIELNDDLPGPFTGLEKLKTLMLNKNNIMRLNQSIFTDMINLEVLNLGDNKIVSIEQNCFLNMKRIRFLCLNHNRLPYLLNHYFVGLNQLIVLLLHSNCIETIQYGTFSRMCPIDDNEFSDLKQKTISLSDRDKCDLRVVSLFNNSKFKDSYSHLFDKKKFKNVKYVLKRFESGPIKRIYRSSEFEAHKDLLKNELYLRVKNE